MQRFDGIDPGEERIAPGIRVRVDPSGDRVYLAGKWLDLGQEHAVAWVDGRIEFRRADGTVLCLGDFPAWVVRGTGKRPAIAVMFNLEQFVGGEVRILPR